MTSPATQTERALSPRARKQAWAESSVRWPVLAIVGLLLVLGVLVAKGVSTGLEERRFLAEGVKVEARVVNIGGAGFLEGFSRADPVPVTLEYLVPGETEKREVAGVLTPKQGATVSVADTIEVLVDRTGRRWTDRLTPVPWVTQLTVALLMMPLLPVLAILALRGRARVLRLYRQGVERTAVVSDMQSSALTPGAKRANVSLVDGDDRRIFPVVWPNRCGPLAKGETIDLIVDPANPTRQAIALRAYES